MTTSLRLFETTLLRCLVLLGLGLLSSGSLQAVTPYTYGQIPTIAADADLTSAYNTWKSRRLKTITCASQTMAWVDKGGSAAFSEGQAYGLLMAAYLENDSTLFTQLWKWYALKMDSRGLMNWQVPGDCGGDNGANAATDADLDAAVALIRAHRRWPAEGWGAKATTLLNAIYPNMVDGCQGLKNGDTWGGCSSGASDAYNPSYFRTAYMPSFDCFEGGSRWSAVRTRSYNILNTAYSNYALPPDWVRNDGSYGRATNSGGYGYDACRAPWSLTQDYLWWGNTSGQNWGRKIALVFGNKNWGSPATAASDTGDDYNYQNGSKVGWNHENAFLGGAAVAFMATTHTAHLDAFYNNLKFNDNNAYYSDSLKVIYLMILTGTFKEPCYGGGPIPTSTRTATPTPYAGTPTQTPMPAFGLVFEDYEAGLTGNYAYASVGSTFTQARSATAGYSSAYGHLLNINLAAGGNGGVGFGSYYANAQGVVDATGAVSLRFWIKTDKNITFQAVMAEAGTPAAPVAGGDGEAWISAAQNVAGTNTWTQVIIPLTGMTEDIYNAVCNPTYISPGPCPTTGNNLKNLTAVSTVQLKFTLGAAAVVMLDQVEFVLGTQPTFTPTRTPFIGSYNQVFDDIESTISLKVAHVPAMSGTYADTANGATATVMTDTSVLRPGGGGNTTSGRINYNTGTGASYGAGAFLLSPYGTEKFVFDASSAVFLGLWINAPAGLRFRLAYQEAGTPTSITAGAEGEAYVSPMLTAAGGWEFIQVETGSFTEDPYNPICNPTSLPAPGPCATSGDGVRDYQGLSSVSIKLDGVQGSGTVYFDDVVFVTSYKTNTPTRTPTATPTCTRTPTGAGTPTDTYTSTPTRSESPTRTSSPTPTHTLTPSYTKAASQTRTDSPTASATHTPQGTLTDSPTHTPFLGSPTFTATLTFSPSASPSATPAPPTFTATPTHSPQPGSPTFTLTAAPPTFTATPTHSPQPGSPTFTLTVLPSTFTATTTHTPAAGSPTVTPTQTPLTPNVGSLSPSNPTAGAAFTLTVNGGSFVVGSQVLVDGFGVATTFVGPTQLTVAMGALAAGTYQVSVSNPSGTLSPLSPLVVVAGPVPTFTSTVTPVPSTPVPVPGVSGPPIIETRPFPNPNPGSVRVHLNGPVQGLEVKVYTPAMMALGANKIGACPGGWVELGLPSNLAANTTSGLYYYVVTAQRNGALSHENGLGRLMLLR